MGGIIKFSFNVPLTDIDLKSIGFRIKRLSNREKKKDGIKKTNSERLLELYEKAKHFKVIYKDYRHTVKKIDKYLKGRLKLKEFKLFIELGTGDAFYTGLLGGAAWSVAGFISSYVSNSYHCRVNKVNVKTNFNHKKFDVDLSCIIGIKLVNIIVVGAILVFNILKRRWYDWLNIRLKD